MDYNTNSGTIFMEDDKNTGIDANSLFIGEPEDTKELSIGKVFFTDYDTVKCDGFAEQTINDFFEMLEQMVNREEIYNTKVQLDNKTLTFMVKSSTLTQEDKLYKILLSDREVNNIRKGIPSRNIRILLTLFDYEKKLHLEKESERKTETLTKEYNEKLLNDARSGKIINEDAKLLYIKELENDLKVNKNVKNDTVLKGFINYIKKRKINVIMCVPIVFGTAGISAYIYTGFNICGIQISPLIFLSTLIYPIITTLNITNEALKEASPEIKKINDEKKVIEHKIKSLKMMKVPCERYEPQMDKDDSNKERVNDMLRKIMYLIEKLPDDSKRKYGNELLSMLNQYQEDRVSLRKDRLVLDTEDMIRNRFMFRLTEFEEKVYNELIEFDKLKEYNDMVMQLEEIIKPKKKIRNIDNKSSH